MKSSMQDFALPGSAVPFDGFFDASRLQSSRGNVNPNKPTLPACKSFRREEQRGWWARRFPIAPF
jgi:hypothetical protein